MTKGLILLCAGGTGGHLFPAQAVAHELKARGYVVHLATDERAEQFAKDFPAEKIHTIKSATFASKNPIAIMKTLFTLLRGYMQSVKLIRKLKPLVVAGFGGYPTLPPLVAAANMGLPSLIHEANAVLGRANRLLASRATKVAMGFGEANRSGRFSITVTGNPVRAGVLSASEKPYPTRKATDKFNLFVFGGSQGASYFSEAIPAAIGLLSDKHRKLLSVVQQARAEDKAQVSERYKQLGITASVESFFTDMPEQFVKSHLVISRAGASTVSELSVVGRPAMLVPFPYALDHDQASNAALMEKAGGASIHPQFELTPEIIASHLTDAISEPKKLALAAENAKRCGKPDATSKLADMLEELASKEH